MLVNLLINPRMLVNLLVKLTRILVISVNLLVNLGSQGMDTCLGTDTRWWDYSWCTWCLAHGETIRETTRLLVRLWRNTRKGKQRLPLYDFHRFFRLSWDKYWESCQTILLLCRFLVLDHRPNTRGPLEVLVGIVLGELDSSTPRVSAIEI